METETIRLEEQAALLLLQEDIPLQPEAAENLVCAFALGLLTLESAEAERKHIDQSIKAGRFFMDYVGRVA